MAMNASERQKLEEARRENERQRRQIEHLHRELDEERFYYDSISKEAQKRLKVPTTVKKIDSFKEEDVIRLVNRHKSILEDLFLYAAKDVRPMYKNEYEVALEMVKYTFESDFLNTTGFKWKLNAIGVNIKDPVLKDGKKHYDAMDSITFEFTTPAEEVYPVDTTADGVMVDPTFLMIRTMRVKRYMLQNAL